MVRKSFENRLVAVGAILMLAVAAAAPIADARVNRIVIDARTSPAFPLPGGGHQSFGAAGQFETIAGRAQSGMGTVQRHR